MDKILVEIYLPAANLNYDVYIPLKSRLFEALFLLSHAFTGLSDGHFTATGDTVICDKITGNILDLNLSVEELGLQNGAKLMLI
jgi:hypothetical protein